jgi:two-component system, cell cycle sensor histidine kinase and response regulator CckA
MKANGSKLKPRDASGQPPARAGSRVKPKKSSTGNGTRIEYAERRLAAIVESSEDAIIGKDLNDIITTWNKGAETIFGYTADEMVGHSIMRLIPVDRQKEENQILEKIKRNESIRHFETLRQTKDGRLIDISLTASRIKDAAGRIIGVSQIARDITAEEVLRRSREEFKDLFDNAPVGFHEIDARGRIVHINNIELKMLGYSAEELLGQFVWKISAEEEMSRRAVLAKLGGEQLPPPEDFERVFRRKDGSTFPVMIKDRLLQREDGVITGIHAAVQDITERKRLDEALRESQVLYHSLVEQLPAGVFRKDAEGRYVFVNTCFCWLKGVKAELFLGRTPQEVVTMEMAAGDKNPAQINQLASLGTDHHQQIMQTGRQIEVDEHGVGPDGKEQHFHVVKSPIFDADGKIVGTQGILFDVTAHVKAEEALKQEQTLLADLLNSVPDFIYFKDRQSRFVRINEAMARRCKLRNADAAPGKTDFDMFTEEHARQAYNDELRIMETGEPMIGYEEKETWPDGSVTWVSTTKMPLRDREGRITGLVGISRNITANKALEEQFRQSQKMEAIGKLAGGVAHDFNNILAVIQMQAGLLKSSEDLAHNHKEFAGEIVVASQRAAALTRQLLLFSRRETMRQSDLDLNESIHNMTKMLRRTLGEDIELQFIFSTKSLFVHADASMMDQVLMNLAVNARDAMPRGGQLVIGTSSVEFDDSVRAQSAQARPGSFVCLSVNDTGCGIPPENLPKIFEPFFTTKEVGKGTGLGLATVHGIVQQHQGWINVYSELGKGTIFRIYLPRLANTSPQKPEAPALTALPGRNETILLVEDDASVRATVRKALTRLGYRVLEAVNGAEALDLWKKNRDQIDLVLTDMVMPGGMTGKELGEQLLRENPGIKLIYASGYSAEVADKDFRLEEGVNFLSKPFEMHKLAQTVRNSLDKIGV